MTTELKAPAIRPGGRFPDYELPDQDGILRRLSALQDGNPMILALTRGEYCPKDRVQHLELVELQPAISVAYTSIVTISTDDRETLRSWRDEIGATWPFLSDVERRIQRELDIKEYTDPTHDAMIPHTLVLAPGLEIYSVYNGYWFWGRPSNSELRRDLREVTKRSRPDWDITLRDLRADWSGTRTLHFPYRSATAEQA